jgi:phage baseplate assembly protein W
MDAQLMTDIRLLLRHQEFRPLYTVAAVQGPGPGDSGVAGVPGNRGRSLDLATVRGRDNLAQAVIMRLLTPAGELAGLGHPDYGSRLHELIGRPNNETTRNLVRLRILETLQREPRIGEVVEVRVGPAPGRRSSVAARLLVKPVGETDLVTIGPFNLELQS